MNLLQNISFTATVERIPNVSFSCNKVTIPGITSNGPLQSNPFRKLAHVPDELSFGNFSLTCLLDEELRGWEEMFKWKLMGFPDNFEQTETSKHDGTHYSDISVVVLNSAYNPIMTFDFSNALPVSISEINFDASQAQRVAAEFTVDFVFDTFKLTRMQ